MTNQQNFPASINVAAQNKTYPILGQQVRVLLHCAQSETGCFCFEQLTPPGLGVPPHTHSREDEIMCVQEGRFEIHLGGRIIQAGAGDTLNFARGTQHGFTNVGSSMGRTIWMVTPGAAFEAFFDVVSSFPPGPPDLTRLDALHRELGIDMPFPNT